MNKGGSRKRAAFVLLVALLLAALALRRRVRTYVVSGRSMLPSYREGDWLVLRTRAPGASTPRRGQVVVARIPGDIEAIKRIRLVDSEGRAWLQGDNADESTDSRDFGPVSPDAIVGRVLFRYWPLT